ncbi:hypothetical protein LINPERHAP1_LOCUS19035 [Linum perenne]
MRLGDESVSEWQQLRRQNQPIGGTHVCSKWHPPTREQQFKINNDAAVFPDRFCHGAGAVIRDSKEGFVGLKQELFPGIIPARECEAKSLLMAIDWMTELHLPSAILETDCQELERAFHKHTSGSSEFDLLLTACRASTAPLSNFNVVFTRRSSNQVAHIVAKQSVSSATTILGGAPPGWLTNVIDTPCLIAH